MMKNTLKSSPYTSSIKQLKKSLLSGRDISDQSQLRMMESSFNHIKPNYINLNREKGVGVLGTPKKKKNTKINIADNQQFSKLYFGKKNPH